ncbi:MAG: hypothetical protein RIR00_172 [Pseudomonadota bacterium]
MRIRLLLLGLTLLLPLSRAQGSGLETGNSPAWSRLQQRLQAQGQNGPAPPLRILHIGDSHTAAIAFSGRLRELWQQRYGDGGPGLLPPGKIPGTNPAPLPLRQGPGWQARQERKIGNDSGLGGYAAQSQRPYQFLGLSLPTDHPDTRLILYTDPEKISQAARYRVFLDQKEIPALTRSPNGRSFHLLPAGGTQLEILSGSGGPAPRLRGLTLLQEGRGASYAVVGVNGAGFPLLQEWQGETVRMQMADFQPDLLILAFGTNDVVTSAFSPEALAQTLQQTETWLRRYARNAAVLLLLPPDLLRPSAQVQRNLQVLREQLHVNARKHGWLLWDWSRVLRGSGRPLNGPEGLYSQDGIHLSAAGYALGANQLFAALTGGN